MQEGHSTKDTLAAAVPRARLALALAVAIVAALALGLAAAPWAHAAWPTRPPTTKRGIDKIKHVVVIMQENRSFDHYFGTFPGANGLPRKDGRFTVCVPDPLKGRCQRPYHDSSTRDQGGPHGMKNAIADINGGRMDGFIREAQKTCTPSCFPPTDVMGYHDAREIPNYWKYAKHYVLQDRMFEPAASWTLPAHMFMVSGWAARCRERHNPMSCYSSLQPEKTPQPPTWRDRERPVYPWTDLTYLLHRAGVSWGYYVHAGNQPDCADAEGPCRGIPQDALTPGHFNPLPFFDTVHETGQITNVKPISRLFKAAERGTLPAVAWAVPSREVSEHATVTGIGPGQAYVTRLVNAIMRGPDWKSTAIFIAWDDWGGFYDHVPPPRVDENGYGLRVPGLMISPYARRGYIDHQTLSFDAYLKFIEDRFLSGRRIDPKTDGRPDSRPTVRENAPDLGDLAREFNFKQEPRRPLILDPTPPPGPASTP